MLSIKEVTLGLLLTVVLTIIAFVLYPYIPGANEVLAGLLLGVIVGNVLVLPQSFKPGVALLSKEGLNLSVIFLGFGISFGDIEALGWQMLILLIAVVFIALILTYVLAKVFRCKTSTGWLVGFGTAICGSSAIAAISGSVTKEKEDVGIALAVVNLLGLAGMLLLPLVFQFIHLQEALIATILGGSLHAVGNVAGAGYSMGDTIGDLAITVKLGRVALLAPGLLFFNFMVNKSVSLRENLKLPYYIWGFMIAVTIVTLVPVPEVLLGALQFSGKVLLTLAMTAIGLNIGIRKLVATGRVAFGFGLIMFAIQILLVWGLAAWWLH